MSGLVEPGALATAAAMSTAGAGAAAEAIRITLASTLDLIFRMGNLPVICVYAQANTERPTRPWAAALNPSGIGQGTGPPRRQRSATRAAEISTSSPHRRHGSCRLGVRSRHHPLT